MPHIGSSLTQDNDDTLGQMTKQLPTYQIQIDIPLGYKHYTATPSPTL